MADKRERPILFSDLMVRAIIEGRKTQTRRIVKPQPVVDVWTMVHDKMPYGREGDRLWVREAWATSGHGLDGPRYEYRAHPADGTDFRSVSRWKPSIHMPRAACRLVLEVICVRLERLQAISEDDAKAEGIEPAYPPGGGDDWTCIHGPGGFRALWDQLNAKRGFGWDVNPWVWVVSFAVIQGPPRPKS